eukprot:gene9121-biopygen13735
MVRDDNVDARAEPLWELGNTGLALRHQHEAPVSPKDGPTRKAGACATRMTGWAAAGSGPAGRRIALR